MTLGVVIGKFEPLHSGNLTILKLATELSSELVIILLTSNNDKISSNLRKIWLQEEFPESEIRYAKIENYQATSSELKPILKKLKDEYKVSKLHLYGSKTSTAKIASDLKENFTVLDPGHLAIPIKKEKLFKNPYNYWDKLPFSVRKSLIKRVVLIGPESVGKSTLAENLKHHHPDIVYLPEYGRNYEIFRTAGPYRENEFSTICETHAAHRNSLLPFSGPLFIEDTDELATSVWSEMLIKKTLPKIDAKIKLPRLYLLMDPSVPFVPEKIRYFDDEKRTKFFSLIEKKLKAHKANYRILTGSWDHREKTTLEIIHELRTEPFCWSKIGDNCTRI